MKGNLSDFYTRQLAKYQAQNAQLNTQIFWLGWARLGTFLGFGGGIYLFIRHSDQYLWLALAVALLILFLLLVKRHIRLFDEREAVRHLIKINENELAVLQHEPSYLADGQQFHSDESYLLDLDVFGKYSLFHALNRTATSLGAQRLADLLKTPLQDVAAIKAQQSAAAALAEQHEFRQQFLAQGLRTQSYPPDYDRMLAWIDRPLEFYHSTFIRVARFAFPILFFLVLILGIINRDLTLPIALFVLNFFVAGRYGNQTSKIHAAISKNVESLGALAKLLYLVNAANFQNETLQNLQNDTTQADQELKKLDRIARFFDQRLNVVVFVLLSGTILYDLQCVFWLERWKLRNKDKLRRWLAAIGELEMLNSLATWQFNHPDYTIPEVVDDVPFIEATALAHPLIPPDECVANDFRIGKGKRLYILTGSNMSGKSTFLRTVGVNMLLARCGAAVCAERFACSPMDIYSSLRQSDSLQEHVSLFYAELRKLQYILEGLAQNPHALVLLDEVLRGTNSDDKLYGSQQLVRRLLDLGCVGLLATHDIDLAKMEDEHPAALGNLCFESIITGGELIFDYKLKTGTAQNRNATFLMRKMGIIG